MGGIEVEDNHDLEHATYSWGNSNDQEHVMEEANK
jgi:hypothetical protein